MPYRKSVFWFILLMIIAVIIIVPCFYFIRQEKNQVVSEGKILFFQKAFSTVKVTVLIDWKNDKYSQLEISVGVNFGVDRSQLNSLSVNHFKK